MQKKRHRANPIIPFLAVGIVVLATDQVTKYLVTTAFELHEVHVVIPGIFNLTYITNTGAAFGILRGAERWRHVFFQVVSVAALFALVYVYRTSSQRDAPFFWGMSLVFGGAMGNLVDRVRYGHVIDFLDFYIGTWHWPAFNVADSAITVGATLLAYHFLFIHDPST